MLLSAHTVSILGYGNNIFCFSLAFRKIYAVYSTFYGFILYQSPDVHQWNWCDVLACTFLQVRQEWMGQILMYPYTWVILVPYFFHPLQATENKHVLMARINTNHFKGSYWNLVCLFYRHNYLFLERYSSIWSSIFKLCRNDSILFTNWKTVQEQSL